MLANAMTKKTDKKSFNDDLDKCFLKHSIPVDVIKRAELLLPYKSYARKQKKQRFLKQLDLNIYEGLKFPNTGMLNKIQEIHTDIHPVYSITNVDKEFFKIVNGRPLSHCIPLYKSLKTLLINHIRIKQEVGYKEDNILNIEVNFKNEKKIYDLSLEIFTEQAKLFDTFIMEDYQNSMKLLEKGEKVNVELDAKIGELQNLADASFTITSRLIGLDYKYSLQQKYGRFLYYLSPPLWRSSNREFARSVEIEVKGFDFGASNEEDTFTVMFEKMRKECFSSRVKPVLYFNHPHELMDIFKGIEQQQLYHFSHKSQLIPHIKFLKDGIKILKQKEIEDSAIVLASIKDFKNLLSFCEEQSTQLKEKFFKVLYGFFYDNVGTIEVLKLTFHLEYCFSKVFKEKPINMDIVTVAKTIESMYMDYSSLLDAIQSDTLRRAMQKCMDMEKRKIDKAKHAAKELRMFYRLEEELLESHGVISQKKNVQSKKIHKNILNRNASKSHVLNKTRQSLTDAEIEYLTLFTDWTKDEDPALYLQSLKIDQGGTNA